MNVFSTLSEIWAFLRARKKWWLAPIILVLMLLGALIVLTEGSAIAPFIYTLILSDLRYFRATTGTKSR